MVPNRMAALVVAFFGIILASQARAVELIQLPDGNVLLRSLPTLEGNKGIEARLNGTPISNFRALDRGDRPAEIRLSVSQICQADQAAYRSLPQGDWVALDRFCSQGQADREVVRFAFISDTQYHDSEHDKAAELIRKRIEQGPPLKFVLNGGDLVQTGGALEEWRSYREIAQAYSAHVPVVPVLGNHEFHKDKQLESRAAIYNTPETSKYYYFLDYGPVGLIVLNSNARHLTDAEAKEQTSWLEALLKVMSGKKVLLAAFHHPAWSSSLTNHLISREDVKYVRNDWMPLLRKYGVRMTLNGHEHLYERIERDGMFMLLAGPAGGIMGKMWPFGRRSGSQVVLKDVRTVSFVTVSRFGQVWIETLDSDTGQPVDTYELPALTN